MPKITKWPFLAGDVLLLGAAAVAVWQGHRPQTVWELALCVGAVALGAILSVIPFALEYRGSIQLAGASVLADSVQRLQNLESIANHVTAATAQWHGIQDQAAQTLRSAKEIADRMAAEAAEFTEFLKKANDAERATLRLEVDKLRRSEGDWLQVVVRMLDHTYALHVGAVRSGKPEFIEQVGAFQHACRDIARRVGLVPFEGRPGEPFDEEKHKPADEQAPLPDDARIRETVGTGIAFQGKLVRPALVVLESAPAPESEAPLPGAPGPASTEEVAGAEKENAAEGRPADEGEATLL